MRSFDEIIFSKLSDHQIGEPSDWMWSEIEQSLSKPQPKPKFKNGLIAGIAAASTMGLIMIGAQEFSTDESIPAQPSISSTQLLDPTASGSASPQTSKLVIGTKDSTELEYNAQVIHDIEFTSIEDKTEHPSAQVEEWEDNGEDDLPKGDKQANDETKIIVADTEIGEENEGNNFDEIDFKASGIQCEGSEITFSIINPKDQQGEIEWIFDNVYLREGSEAVYLFESSGQHKIHMIFRPESGEIINRIKEVNIHALPDVNILFEPVVIAETFNREVNISASPSGNTYEWYVNGSYQGRTDGFQTNLDAGMHEVSLKAISEFGCISKVKETHRVDRGLELLIPNAFTPNNDGKNDTWLPINMEYLESFRLKITRANDLTTVYETTELVPWNGQLPNGDLAISGEQFFVQIVATDREGVTRERQEVVTIPSSPNQ